MIIGRVSPKCLKIFECAPQQRLPGACRGQCGASGTVQGKDLVDLVFALCRSALRMTRRQTFAARQCGMQVFLFPGELF